MSLAFADLLVAVVVMPFAAIELTTGHWRYGHVFCLVRTSLDVQLTTASILHLCCIALDRWVSCSVRVVNLFNFLSGGHFPVDQKIIRILQWLLLKVMHISLHMFTSQWQSQECQEWSSSLFLRS